MDEWEVVERLPKYNVINTFSVEVYGQIRIVKRVGNEGAHLAPGILIFTDCTHPQSNIICDESAITAWKLIS